MNAKDCLDDCGGKITRLDAAYDTLLNSYIKETRENALGEGCDIVVSLVTARRKPTSASSATASNSPRTRSATAGGDAARPRQLFARRAEVERLFSQPIDAEGSHALGVVATNGRQASRGGDFAAVCESGITALRPHRRVGARGCCGISSRRSTSAASRFACNAAGIGASRAEFKILDDVNADIKKLERGPQRA